MGSIVNIHTKQIEDAERQKNAAYSERNKLVALAAKMAIAIGLNAGLAQHDPDDKEWEDDWRTIVFIDLPTGQTSWHIHDSEKPLFQFLPKYEGKWDGHTTEEKYQRIADASFEFQRRRSGKAQESEQ